MQNSELDRMIEIAVERLAQDDKPKSLKLVREMAIAWPDEPALGIVFALTSAASALEDVIDTEDSERSSRLGYKLAALVSADIFAIEAMLRRPATGKDLMHFWRRVDPYFLEL